MNRRRLARTTIPTGNSPVAVPEQEATSIPATCGRYLEFQPEVVTSPFPLETLNYEKPPVPEQEATNVPAICKQYPEFQPEVATPQAKKTPTLWSEWRKVENIDNPKIELDRSRLNNR